jgi:hypothetical protein
VFHRRVFHQLGAPPVSLLRSFQWAYIPATHRRFARAEILASVIYPFAFANEREIWSDYRKLRARLSNQSVRIAAARLFANNPRQGEFLRRLAGQQGLLQIYEDFCLRDASDCAQCPFPEQVLNE